MKISMPFKPKAQILLQLGEQLIKSESVAILELIKNAYDADAKNVVVTMMNIDEPEKGYIEIIDDGVGMNLWTVQNVWMEPGNTHKKDIVTASKRSSLNRLPIGEKGIGRFGVHKLGKKIEMITRSANEQEIYVSIDWDSFANAKYLEDVHVVIEERTPEFFTNGKTGTKLYISNLSACWTRGMLRNVYRSVTSLSSPFNSIDAFRVKFKTDKKDWLKGLLSFENIKKYALYTGSMEIEGGYITKFTYSFSPFSAMTGLKSRNFEIQTPVLMLEKAKGKRGEVRKIDIGKFNIGKVKIDLLVFDRDSSFRARYIEDKRTYGAYLDENGGVRVFRDGVRIYDYGEQGNDWLGLDIAQRKLFVSRMVPGIMIPVDTMKTYQDQSKLKSGNPPDYIFSLSPVEFEGKNWNLAFNVNQMFAISMDKLIDENLICALTGSYVTAIKQRAASCVSKHGIEVFGGKR